MSETFNAAFSMMNIIPTSLLLLVLVYWLTVIVGVFNVDSFDIDADADIDADVDISATDSILWVNSALSFFNLGKIPLMLILSFFSLSLWVISMLMNYHLNDDSFLLSIVYLIPNIFVSAFVTKFLTRPFVKLFKKADSDIESNKKLTGKLCIVTLDATHNKMGQAEIKIDGSSFMINVMSTEEQYSLLKGDQCLVIDYLSEQKIYLIEPYKN
ncbi:OB-fold-containig protein [Saccharicrinis fermentans]|uniref:NfeD-like C-terminal domain-containing protein n=1 Tax=Saccharicrinis fermentans DSM 9555 = JCM 21142 TaxID=869213 RepID=W7Y0L8_9BACT|nr:OB-fold-containig protein [Saccharicrinis fermentans]GAF04465.1 hypothetical protein JCM21142_83172 [Saccharicrinis fermentans DSM 9555 = JCM 21142]